MCDRGHASLGMCGRGHVWQGGMHGKGGIHALETNAEACGTHPTEMYSCERINSF